MREWVDTLNRWYSLGKGVIRQGPGRMLSPGYWGSVPTAQEAFRSAFIDTADGAQTCIPDGLGGWAWIALKDILTQAAADARYVNVTGDTMQATSGNTALTIRSPSNTNQAELWFGDNSALKWAIYKTVEAGGSQDLCVWNNELAANAFCINDADHGVTFNGPLVTPTITNFTNAQHDHLDAGDGGLLTAAAISDFRDAIVVPEGRGRWMADEFLSGVATSGQIGELGWSATASGAGTITAQALGNIVGHHGTYRLTTGTTDNGGMNLHIGANTALGHCRITEFIFASNSYSNMALFAGIFATVGAGDGIYLEFDTDAGHTNWMATKVIGGVATRTSLGLAPVINEWYYARITQSAVNSGSFEVYVERLGNGNNGALTHTGLTTTGFGAHRVLYLTRNTTTKVADVDYFAGYIETGVRV